jgi:hypothetical protein
MTRTVFVGFSCKYLIVTLFTPEEKEKIEKEFTYSQRVHRNRGIGATPSQTTESDWFTEQNIESTQNDLTRNASTQSVILAPFNSTLTHQSELHESMEDLILDKKVVKLAAKVRDVDRQYEKNNNCEVDNGVYNKFAYDSESNSQLNPLESNEKSLAEDSEVKEESTLNCISSASDMKDKYQVDETVQALLVKSLAPKPLEISITLENNRLIRKGDNKAVQ